MTKVGVITQARMTSRRLPGKVLLSAGQNSMLAHQARRLASVKAPLIIATTTNSSDDPIIEAAEALGIAWFRGSESDVLGRFADAADDAELDVVVRVTADCPLIDAGLINRGIEMFLELDNPYAHVSNVLERSYPRGFDFEVFSARALRVASERATDPVEREHVTPYLYANRSGPTTLHAVRRYQDASQYRVTLDTPEDLELIKRLIEQYGADEKDAEGIIEILNSRPDLVRINAGVEQKKLGQ